MVLCQATVLKPCASCQIAAGSQGVLRPQTAVAPAGSFLVLTPANALRQPMEARHALKLNRSFLGNSELLQASNPQKSQQRSGLKAVSRGLKVVSRAAEPGVQGIVTEQPPSSREEAVSQARTALQSVMVKFVAKQGRRKGGIAGQMRLQVEVPVADDSARAQIQLAHEVCNGVFSDRKRGLGLSVAVFVASEEARKVAAQELQNLGGASVTSISVIHEGETFPGSAGAALLIGPKELQIPHLKSIVGTAGGRPILLINPEWPDASEFSDDRRDFVASFDVCYSFLPLNIEAMLSKFEGAVLKYVKSGPSAAAPWVIFAKGPEGLKPVKTYKTRPTSKDLEDIFYNYSASQSPVNKGIGFLRGLVGKGKK